MAYQGVDDAAPPLFQSLLQALDAFDALGDVTTGLRLKADESVRRELQEWRRSCSLDGNQRDRYAAFYRRLVDALRHQQRTKAHLVRAGEMDDEAVAEWVEADWLHDQETLLREDASSTDSFSMALFAIASMCVHQTGDSDDGDTQRVLLIVKELRGKCNDGESVGVVTEKKPLTMAEKLAQMRSQRTALVAKEASTRSVAASTEAVTLKEVDAAPLAPASSVSTDSLRGDLDDSSHYFTIETRLELKERLRALQLRLDELLLQTKLAWMKCFAHPSGQGDDTSLSSHDGDEAVAAQLVAQGETLAFHLLDAFQKARKASCPIGDYKALVAMCEAEFDAFQALVNATAFAPSPMRSKRPSHEPYEMTSTDECAPTTIVKPLPAAFDLPSMKAYYDRAAPSYAAYLPAKKR